MIGELRTAFDVEKDLQKKFLILEEILSQIENFYVANSTLPSEVEEILAELPLLAFQIIDREMKQEEIYLLRSVVANNPIQSIHLDFSIAEKEGDVEGCFSAIERMFEVWVEKFGPIPPPFKEMLKTLPSKVERVFQLKWEGVLTPSQVDWLEWKREVYSLLR